MPTYASSETPACYQRSVLNLYIDTLGHRLVANANDVKTPFQFFMIRDRNINAFLLSLVVMLHCTQVYSCTLNRKVNLRLY